MTILVQQLRAEIEQLKAENSSLRDALADKVVDSTKLRAFLPADGGFTIGLEGSACALLADAFGEQLYTSEAINYLQLTFTSGAYPDLGEIVVTLQRCTGKTPHELRINAEQERDQLKAENAELRRDTERYRWLRNSAPSRLAAGPVIAMAEADGSLLARADGHEVLLGREDADAAIDQAMTKEQP